MQVEEKYMLRCLELAKAGRSSVAPNPMVGAVIVHKGQIIGEGFHRQYGGAHAEVNAIQAVRDETLLRDSTLYVNLEPCVHDGKTPPCVSVILQKQLPRVVVGCLDPFPEVAGRGVKALREAGVDVVTDVLKGEAMALNRIFITAHTRQRPYIILKWAQSSDGYIDRIRKEPAEKPVQLSIPVTRRYVHKLRSEVSAIMVGTNTARLDNPFLTVSHWSGNSPVRVFPDRTRRIPASYHLLDGSVRTLVVVQEVGNGGNRGNGENRGNGGNRGSGGSREILRSYDLMVLRSCTGSSENVEYIAIDFSAPVIPQLLHVLYSRRLYSLLVEGGAQMHKSFLDAGLWDEIHVETAPVMLGNGVKAPVCNLDEIATLQHTLRFSPEPVSGEDFSYISIYTSKNL